MSGMKCLVENLLISVSADSADTNYPVTNVTDGHPSSPWRADGLDTATLTATVAAEAEALGIAGTNADFAEIVISDPNEVYIADTAFIADDAYFVSADTSVTFDIVQTGGAGVIVATFDAMEMPITVSIKLTTATGTIIEAGQLEIGKLVSIAHNPRYGLTQSGQSYSLKKILSNGARWTKKRQNVRTFSGSVFVERETDFYSFMDDIAREVDTEPRFWWVTSLGSGNWAVYAELTDWPSGNHAYYNHSIINFSLIEVL